MGFFNRLILFSFLIAVLYVSVGKAAESIDDVNDTQTVRIGLIDVMESEQKVRGLHNEYVHAYFRELSKHTNLNYEFKTGKLEQCREWLINGDVDLIGPVQYEENDEFIFSLGNTCYGIFSLYCHREDYGQMSERVGNLNGVRIGILKNPDVENYLSFFIEENGGSASVQTFTSMAKMMTAFHNNELDLIVDDGSHITEEEIRLAPIGQASERFMTTPNHKELLDKLNHAIKISEIKYPFFLSQLQYKYLYKVLQVVSPYHEEERKFIEQAPILKAVFLPAQLPLFDASVSPSKGIYADYLKMISEESGLDFEILEATSNKELGEMLWTGKADIAFIIYAEGTYYSTVYFTNEIDQELFVAIVPRDTEKLPESVTVGLLNTFNGTQSYWKNYKPDWTQKYYNTLEDCLNALENEECDIAFLPARIIQRENSMIMHPSLKTDDSNNVQIPICLAISPRQPQILQDVLNTAILHLDKKEMDMTVQKNLEPVISLNYALAAYPLPTAIVLFIVTGASLLAGTLFFRNISRKKQNKILLEKNIELETALLAVENMRIDRDNYRTESEVDKLTQLYNKDTTKRICSEKIKELEDGESAILYIIDLDHFKEANDNFGHQYGDRILVEFAVRLRHIFRSNDCVGRFGGDEFIAMIVGVMTDDVIFRKAKQIQQVASQLDVDGKLAGITASIGIAATLPHDKDYEALFRQADESLYCVKENGRNGYCLEPPNVIH